MPIKGLTDRRRMPRVGKIHLGERVINANGREYPRAVDYFVCPPEVQAVHGARPTQLPIVIPVNEWELAAQTWYKAYSTSRGLVCKGDGERARRLIDRDKITRDPFTNEPDGPLADRDAGETEWVDGLRCPGEECPYFLNKQCRPIMNLQFLLPDVPGLGVWQLDTSSYHGILNVHSGLAFIESVFGRVAGVPLLLSLEPQEVAPDGRKKTVHVLHLRQNITLAEIQARTDEHLHRPALVPAVMPEPDEDRNDLLYPEKGFAVDDSTGEIVDAPAPSRQTGWPAIRQMVEQDGLLEWADFGAAVLRSSADAFITRCQQAKADPFTEATRLYAAWYEEQRQPDAASDAEVDAPPPSAVSPDLTADGKPACRGCGGDLHPMDADGICAYCRRQQDEAAQAAADEVDGIISEPMPAEQGGLLPA